MSFQNVFTHGNLVDINVSVWSGQRRMLPEDLGLAKEKISEIFSLGHKNLIPPEIQAEFKCLEYKARNLLLKNSLPFEFGFARFVPKKVMLKFAEDMELIIEEFNKKADDFAANYENYKQVMHPNFLKAAEQAYARMRIITKERVNKENYVAEFMERVEKFYPPADTIRSKFNMSYVPFRMELPDISKGSFDDISEEHSKLKLYEDAYSRAMEKRISSFVDTLVINLRDKAKETLTSIHDVLKSGKCISNITLDRVGRLLDDYETMDIVGDTQIKDMIRNFKNNVLPQYTAKQLRENNGFRKALCDDLQILISAVSDYSGIQALAENYRKQIKL